MAADNNGNFIFEFLIRQTGTDETVKKLQSLNQATQECEKRWKAAAQAATALKSANSGNKQELEKVAVSTKKAAIAADQHLNTLKKGSGAAMAFGMSLGSLAMRALAVAPIWMIIRGGIQMVVQSFKEGIQHITTFDKALAQSQIWSQRIPNNMTSSEWRKGPLAGAARGISLETGISSEDYLKQYRIFAMGGQSATESLYGANASTRLAITLQGDYVETSRAILDVYNLLGDRISGVSSSMDKMNKIAYTMAILDKDNVYELNEMAQAIKSASGAASVYNLTMEQTMSILAALHTGGQRGGVAGTQISTMLARLGSQRKIVESFLGSEKYKEVTPGGNIKYFETLMAIMEKANRVYKQTGNLPANDILEIFGMRGMKGAGTAIGQWDVLLKNIKTANMSVKELQAAFSEMYSTMIDTIDIQTKRFGQLRNITMEYLITGTDGAGDLVRALKLVNNGMEGLLRTYMKIRETEKVTTETLQNRIISAGQQGVGGKTYFEDIDYAISALIAKMGILNPAFKILADLMEITIASKQSNDNIENFFGTKGLPQDVMVEEKVLEKIKNQEVVDVQKELNFLYAEATNNTAGQLLELDNLKLTGIDQIEIEKRKLELMIKQRKTSEELFLQTLKIKGLEQKEELRKKTKTGSLAESYKTADAAKRAEIYRWMEIQNYKPEEISRMYEMGGADKSIISANLGNMTPEQRQKIQESILNEFNLPGNTINRGSLGSSLEQIKGMGLPLDSVTFQEAADREAKSAEITNAEIKNFAEKAIKSLDKTNKDIEDLNRMLKDTLT